jgi:ATP-dependent Clp protease ATP-binding subunit ClpC
MYPFERFTEPAKRVLSGAQEEAEVAGHNYIGTEHLLLGIMRAEQGVAARALAGLGIEQDDVRRVVSAVLGRGEALPVTQIIPTTRVKKVIQISFAEALRGGRHHVGTAHLLMALVIEGEGIAAHVLKDMYATRDKVEAAIAEVEAGGLKEASGGG